MGIPSYFSHFVCQHRKIIKQISSLKSIDNLYLDCNGFIYEGVNSLKMNKGMDESILIKFVCDKLISYINLLKPNKNVFIAFDGVAPVAKLDQQRKRRFLSWFQTKTMNDYLHKNDTKNKSVSYSEPWNTSAITPGTLFMNKLTQEINKRFNNPSEFGLEKFIVSCADEAGEGEHKLFSYIRKNVEFHSKTTTVIYGLDADLIMLTLNHLNISDKLFLFRETPVFIKSIDNTLNPNELYLLDIPEFGKSIVEEFTHVEEFTCYVEGATSLISNNNNKINDYIFIFFLLGNDFMPHFPSLNIRTNGITLLLTAYKLIISSKNLSLIEDGQIVWKNLRLFIEYLSVNELAYLKKEYFLRSKTNNRFYNNKNMTKEKEFENKLINMPMTDRATELYINPNESGWEERYYHILFDLRIDDERRKEICMNYLEGLEWTFKYYSGDCVDWRWTYKYNYPPLLVDLIKYIPYFQTDLIAKNNNKPVREIVQLGYVLPRQSLGLMPELSDKLLLSKPEWYVDHCDFQWAFCKYFWESHVKLPEIDIDVLDEIR